MNCKLFSQIIQCFFSSDFRITELSFYVTKVLCNSQVSSTPSRAVKHHFGTDRLESCKRLSCGSAIGLFQFGRSYLFNDQFTRGVLRNK